MLVPRYRKLTGSTAATVVLGGLTYAALHLTEYWTRYDTVSHAALSVIFIFLFYGGPDLVKAYLTLWAGNAWVHLWGWHAIAPHVTIGEPPLCYRRMRWAARKCGGFVNFSRSAGRSVVQSTELL